MGKEKAKEKRMKAEKRREAAAKAEKAEKEKEQKEKEKKEREKKAEIKEKEKAQKKKEREDKEKRQKEIERERDSKEKKAKRIAKEKKDKEIAQKEKDKKEKQAKERTEKKERADKERIAKEKAAKVAERAAKEAERAAKEKAAKEKAEKKVEREKKAELAEKRRLEREAKAERAAKEADAKAKERGRKLQCQKKKLAREKQIKSQYPRKLSISYRGGWKYYGDGTAPLAVYVKGNICQLEGVLRKTGHNKLVAKLNDRTCRPRKTMYFAANHGTRQVGITVNRHGYVHIGGDGNSLPAWVSLSGLVWTRGSYLMESTTALLQTGVATQEVESQAATRKLLMSNQVASSGAIRALNGWRGKQTLVAHKHGNLCILAGQLESDTWLKPDQNGLYREGTKHGHRFVAQLPGNCRPYERVMFTTYGKPNGVPLRVDVLPNGKVEVVANAEHRALEPIISLQGIVFATSGGSALKLKSGFEPYGHGYQKPMAKQEHGICHLQGLIRGEARPRQIATLPKWCRPAKKLIFNAPNNMYVHRLEVHPSGAVYLKEAKQNVRPQKLHGGGKKEYANFISVSAITFPIPYESAYGAIMAKRCDQVA